VDCDLLEASKENIQPLKSGRRVTALQAVLSTPHPQRDAQHQATKARHRLNIQRALADDDDEDPLEAYTSFITWTLEAYPQGHSADSGLLELLEEATRVLLRGRRWNDELGYLKLWILYARYVEKPWIVYAFLVANEVGTGWAGLYEEYAGVLEGCGRYVLLVAIL
jgi:spindle assembly checkpoint component MAD3